MPLKLEEIKSLIKESIPDAELILKIWLVMKITTLRQLNQKFLLVKVKLNNINLYIKL